MSLQKSNVKIPHVIHSDYTPSVNYVIEHNNNFHTNEKVMDKYLCDTIEESIKSIDKALSVKSLD